MLPPGCATSTASPSSSTRPIATASRLLTRSHRSTRIPGQPLAKNVNDSAWTACSVFCISPRRRQSLYHCRSSLIQQPRLSGRPPPGRYVSLSSPGRTDESPRLAVAHRTSLQPRARRPYSRSWRFRALARHVTYCVLSTDQRCPRTPAAPAASARHEHTRTIPSAYRPNINAPVRPCSRPREESYALCDVICHDASRQPVDAAQSLRRTGVGVTFSPLGLQRTVREQIQCGRTALPS